MSSVILHPSSTLHIGTRKSPLALAQAEMVRGQILALHPQLAVELVHFTTSGDRFVDRKLAEIGGKGLFTKELEEALLDGRIDLAVHSLKDMQTVLPEGLALACVPEREDARDLLVSPRARTLAELPEGARMGTSSLRRGAQALRVRPDLRIVPLRGNVQTRLRKIEEGEADATLLAVAGCKRLGLSPLPGEKLSVEEMLPAVAQGALGLECRAGDARVLELLAPLNHAESHAAVRCERAMLARLDGSCRTPIAGLAVVEGEALRLRGMLLSEDGRQCREAEMTGVADEAEALGVRVAEQLLE